MHPGLDKAPARSTLSYANNKRSYLVFETKDFKFLKQYHNFISNSPMGLFSPTWAEPTASMHQKAGILHSPIERSDVRIA
jgi:hypothetical protein